MSERTEWFEVRGLRLAVHAFGDSSRPVVLMLHGFLDQGRSFRPVAEALADELYVLAPDFRGHGRSSWIGAGGYYHFQDYYADMFTMVQTLGLDRFSVLGHSMGGSVAVGLANLMSDRIDRMIVMEGFGPPAEPIEHAPDRLGRFVHALARPAVAQDVAGRRRARRAFASVEEAAERLCDLNARLAKSRALELAADGTEPSEDGRGVVWRFDPLHRTPSARPFNFEEFKHFLIGLEVPVLGLYGADSTFPFGDLEARHQLIEGLRLAVVPGAAHNIHHDRPDLVAGAARFWFLGDYRGALPQGLIETSEGVPELG